ncbi:hypothetical protein WA026_016781 [Henosepilachna vigintioctopunctata]|uniref:Uncharacterized protein n=1 Tax=Henosepilachna vigintioctopunctata TaxID=420089 RepID=A0AAW1UZ94_9CUCU
MSCTYLPNKMFFLKLSIFVCCVILIKAEGGEPHVEACLEETKGNVTYDEIKRMETTTHISEFDNIPTRVYCVLQCALKKSGVLVGEMIDSKKLAAEKFMAVIKYREPFLECVEKIEYKECDDMKTYMKCMIKYFNHDLKKE